MGMRRVLRHPSTIFVATTKVSIVAAIGQEPADRPLARSAPVHVGSVTCVDELALTLRVLLVGVVPRFAGQLGRLPVAAQVMELA
ncbi:hypothetical protein Srufu_020000 [Streptomyces libani subsp. rufus]|nr:hypothetical protein Srufu_020000 [Streptomyces libani subsp. rufus]